MAISVTAAVGSAFSRTGRILFKPFDIKKWFVLGFCAWLAHLGEGGGAHFNVGQPGNVGQAGGSLNSAMEWIKENMGLVIFVAVLVLLVVVAITLVVTWLRSRGKFMFLDGVVCNRGAVVEPWHRLRTPGNSLFGFSVVLGLIGAILFGLLILVCLAVAWSDIQARTFGPMAISALVIGSVLFSTFLLIFTLVAFLLEDFIVPVMYLRGVRTLEAWRLFGREILVGNVGKLVLFYLMKIVLAMAIAVIAILATCLTCCLAALPYLGTVILLPVFVFSRCYSLCFIEQFGNSWRLFEGNPAAPGVRI